MAWNQPGNNGERPNPWGGGGGKKGGNNPPGLDDLLKKLNGMFGGGSGGGKFKETDLLKWALGASSPCGWYSVFIALNKPKKPSFYVLVKSTALKRRACTGVHR
jgi:hypothetical protein